MRRCILLGLALAALLLTSSCISFHPRVWTVITSNPRFATLDPSYGVTFNWVGVTVPSITGYLVTLNGDQQADVASTVSSYHFTGLDCGTTYTLGVQAHDGATPTSNKSLVYSTSYTTPSCDGPFPLQVSGNGRFIETANGDPWLMVGDSPWAFMGNANRTHIDAYFADRASHGFNTILFSILCDAYISCSNSNGDAFDGTAPFTSGTGPSSYNLNDPSSTYFGEAHNYIADAEADGLAVMVDPIDTGGCVTSQSTGGWLPALTANGDGTVSTTDNDYKFGQYLGTTFSDLPNIVWMSGNDFQCIETTADRNDALSVANGIHNTDPTALQTLETDFCGTGGGDLCEGSSSLVDSSGTTTGTGWASVANLNLAYTYSPTYAQDRTTRGQSSTQPMFLGEANYEGQQNPNTDGCGAGIAGDTTARICRLQEWWTATSGAAGDIYGGPCFAFTDSTSLSSCDTVGATELQIQTDFLDTIAWQSLVPDTSHTLITSGFGTCSTTGLLAGVNCVTDAQTADQTLALAYFPDPGGTLSTATVDMTQMAGSTTARWLDPTDGSFTSIVGSPFANTGTHNFTPPGTNNAGDSDWVLVLQG